MKKRKIKLFASIASLGLVVAVMGVGVLAASKQAVQITSTASFSAISVDAKIEFAVGGNMLFGAGATEAGAFATITAPAPSSTVTPLAENTKITLADFTADDAATTAAENTHTMSLKLADPDQDGTLEATGENFTYTFTITNTAVANDRDATLYYVLVYTPIVTVNTDAFTISDSASGVASTNAETTGKKYIYGTIASDAAAANITLTFAPGDIKKSFNNVNFGNVTIGLGGTEAFAFERAGIAKNVEAPTPPEENPEEQD